MTEERFKRKLTAILSANVEGYSLLVRKDEESTVETLKAYRGIMSELIRQQRGRLVDSPGDNVLAEFGHVVDAVNCAWRSSGRSPSETPIYPTSLGWSFT
jgi:adenylate cyclase